MGRVSPDTLEKLSAFFDSLPAEQKNKCAICNETLTHIVKTAEARVGAGTATITRMIAERVNESAAPQDKVSGEALVQRVRQKEGRKDSIMSNRHNRIKSGADVTKHNNQTNEIHDQPVTNTPTPPTENTPLAREIARVSNGHFATDSDGTRYPVRDPKLREKESRVNKIIFPHLFHPIKNVNTCPVKPEEVYEMIPDYCLGQLEGLGEAISFLSEIKRLHEESQ